MKKFRVEFELYRTTDIGGLEVDMTVDAATKEEVEQAQDWIWSDVRPTAFFRITEV